MDISPDMNRKTSRKTPTLARDSRGRFLPRAAVPAAIWLPDHRWLAPSAADRDLARAVVAAADARLQDAQRSAELELAMARQVAVRPTGPCALHAVAAEGSVWRWRLYSFAAILTIVLGACVMAR